jgi:hypothetical protein
MAWNVLETPDTDKYRKTKSLASWSEHSIRKDKQKTNTEMYNTIPGMGIDDGRESYHFR